MFFQAHATDHDPWLDHFPHFTLSRHLCGERWTVHLLPTKTRFLLSRLLHHAKARSLGIGCSLPPLFSTESLLSSLFPWVRLNNDHSIDQPPSAVLFCFLLKEGGREGGRERTDRKEHRPTCSPLVVPCGSSPCPFASLLFFHHLRRPSVNRLWSPACSA